MFNKINIEFLYIHLQLYMHFVPQLIMNPKIYSKQNKDYLFII